MGVRTLAELLYEACDAWQDKPFILNEEGVQFNFISAVKTCNQLANYFISIGVKRWDRVAIISSNESLLPVVLFAINRIGAIAVIINEQTTDGTLRVIMSEVEPALVLCHSTLRAKVDASVRCNVLEIDFLPTLSTFSTERIITPACSSDPALIIYTSGSTGKPKGVVLSNDNVLFASEKIQERLCYRSSDVVGLFLPMSFDYGLYQVFLVLLAGASIYISKGSNAGPALASNLKRHAVTVFPGVPHLFGMLTLFLSRKKTDLSDIRLCTNTGAHLPDAQVANLCALLPNAEFALMYGLTECKRVSILRAEERIQKPGSVGKALCDTGVLIVDDEGKPVPPGEVGELIVFGRHLALGYWRSPEETALRYKCHPSGMGRALYSGDNFKADSEGYLYYVGRRDEQIKRNGFRINRLEIENTALQINGIQNASLFLHKDNLVLFLECSECDLTKSEILHFLANNLESYKVPDAIEILESFPVSSNGKVDRKAIEMELL